MSAETAILTPPLADSPTIAPTPHVSSAPSPSLPLRRFSVAEYHQMIDAGVFARNDRVELLEGWIVQKMARKPIHDGTINWIAGTFGRRLPLGWLVRVQSSLTTEDSQPEPDVAVVRGEGKAYMDRHPGPGDVALVVEVAGSSLTLDRDTKMRIYARSGIPQYWIVNVLESTIEVYTQPSLSPRESVYESLRHYHAGESISVQLDNDTIEIAVADLLP